MRYLQIVVNGLIPRDAINTKWRQKLLEVNQLLQCKCTNYTSVFSDKSSNSNKITLVEKDLILERNNDIAEIFNDFFTSVASNLNIPRYQDPFIDIYQTENRIGRPILRIID